MFPMTNYPQTDGRHTDHISPPVQLVKIDQMSQCNLKSENLTMRTDHWHEDQTNPICSVSFANNTDESETIKVDEN